MMKYEKFGNQTIFYKSSEDLSELKDNLIDVIVTSPPYNRSKLYTDDLGNKYNDKQPKEKYLGFLLNVWRECYRVLSPEGLFFLNIGDSATDQGLSEEVVKLAEKAGFIRLQTIIWVKTFLGKGHYTPTGGLRRFNNIWENIFVLVKDKKRYNLNPNEVGIPYADKSNIGRYGKHDIRDAGNVWLITYSKTTGATIKKNHEAPFPIELPYRCIKVSGGKNVLDPFAGTGSTLAAAQILGKIGYGYEKYPRREVIKKKILQTRINKPSQTLLPHLELSIRILTSLYNNIEFNNLLEKNFFNFSKKEQVEMSILKNVLDDLTIKFPIIDQYFNWKQIKTSNDKNDDNQMSLSKFFRIDNKKI